jgi:oxaloacetate decarboxylase alpha subunit
MRILNLRKNIPNYEPVEPKESIMDKRSKKEAKEEKLHKIPLRITDTTLRDAHQSLWATRMRTQDILGIVEIIDKVGFYSLECWGGATFDACLRFLRENPWERLRAIKAKAKNTPLQMLLRGQNLVGYRHYADDVVDRFIALACENGMDIFRVFDALNDTRNLETAIKAIKKHGGHAQGTLCYTISPVHTIDKYVKYGKEQLALGIDSICIKDMAGILSPLHAERLVTALIKELKIPVQLHCHASSGMATSTYVDGVRAGAGAIDCAVSSMAGFSSQPPVETLVAIFNETNYRAELDMEALDSVARYFAELAPKRCVGSAPSCVIDPGILVHQIPGGMISNFRSQLANQNALDKLKEALDEVTRVREDLGWPPLVTPTSQIVGTQAVMNVLAGERYKMVPNEVKDYLRGLYGRPPAPIDPAFVKKILGDEKPITHRPADDLKPMLPNATEGLDPKLVEHEEDILSYVIYPQPAIEYFKWRAAPADQKPEIPADTELKKAQGTHAPQPAPAPAPSAQPAASQPAMQILDEKDYRGLVDLVSRSSGLGLNEITIRKGDFVLSLRGDSVQAGAATPSIIVTPAAPASQAQAAPAPTAQPAVPQPAPEPAPAQPQYSSTINAPLVGTFYSTGGPGKPRFVEPGAVVNAGDKVCIVEAMKLFNEIEAPYKCKIVKFLLNEGEPVQKDQPLIGVEKL